MRGGAVRQRGGLIIRRSQVRILPPLPPRRAARASVEVAIDALRKRLAEAKRVHLVALRDARARRHEDVHIQIARERLEMTPAPARTR